MLTTSGFHSKPNKYYVSEKCKRKNFKKNKNHLVRYEYSTDILDNLISIRHQNIDQIKFRNYDHYDLENDYRLNDYPLKNSSSLPSIRSYYAIPEVRTSLNF